MRFYLKSCGQCGAIMLQQLSSTGIFCCSLNLQHILGSFRFYLSTPIACVCSSSIISHLSTCLFRIRQQRPGIFYAASRFFHDYTIQIQIQCQKRLLQPKQPRWSPGICWNTPWKLWPFGTVDAWPCVDRWISGISPRQFWWPRTPSMERGEDGIQHGLNMV